MKTETDLRHCDDLTAALADFRTTRGTVHRWGAELAVRLAAGGRLLAAGNGGSAAQAQHLTAELVGRYRDERPAYSALALHADTSSTTAIANDYGVQEVFARQVAAHGRPGDVLMLLSTSGASANLLAAAGAARAAGLRVWALTGPDPNPLAAAADSALCVRAGTSATVQELHLVAVHMLCEAFDQAVGGPGTKAGTPPAAARPAAAGGPALPDPEVPAGDAPARDVRTGVRPGVRTATGTPPAGPPGLAADVAADAPGGDVRPGGAPPPGETRRRPRPGAGGGGR